MNPVKSQLNFISLIMVNKCVVVGCSTNYESMRKKTKVDSVESSELVHEKISTFHFPTEETLKRKWIKFVCRGNDYLPSKNSVICSSHFEEKYLLKGEKRIRLNFSLSPVPTIYPKDFVPQSSILPSASNNQQRKPPREVRHVSIPLGTTRS